MNRALERFISEIRNNININEQDKLGLETEVERIKTDLIELKQILNILETIGGQK